MNPQTFFKEQLKAELWQQAQHTAQQSFALPYINKRQGISLQAQNGGISCPNCDSLKWFNGKHYLICLACRTEFCKKDIRGHSFAFIAGKSRDYKKAVALKEYYKGLSALWDRGQVFSEQEKRKLLERKAFNSQEKRLLEVLKRPYEDRIKLAWR